jgi:hypothetical protein
VATFLTPFYVLTTCLASLANDLAWLSVPKSYGTVSFKNGDNPSSMIITQNDRDKIRMETPNQWLNLEPKAGASFIFRDRADNHQLHTNLISVGSYTDPTKYWYPCGGAGGLTIGWKQGNKSKPCRNFIVSSGSAKQVSLDSWENTSVAQANKSFLKAQQISRDVEYCNAVADSGKGWGFGSSVDGIFSGKNPCETALEKCSETSKGSDCSVTSWATWNLRERDLIASRQCDRSTPTSRRETGRTIATKVLLEFLQEALRSQASSCELNVYRSDEIIISPVNDQLTLVHTDRSGDGAIVVNVIAGTVEIRAATNLQAPVTVSRGNRIFYGNNRFFNEGLLDAEQVARAPSVQGFLNSGNWPRDFRPQLEEYRDAINQVIAPQ